MGESSPRSGGDGLWSPRLGRPPVIERDAVVAAAIAVGFDSLTVTGVAKRMGVRPSALYRHFPGRTELAAAAVEQVVAGAAWPGVPGQPGRQWREHLGEVVWTAWNLYDRHPGLAVEVAALVFAPPTLAAVSQRIVEVLRGAGFEARDAVLIADMAGELALGPFLLARDPDAARTSEADLGNGDGPVGVLDRIAARRRRLMRASSGKPGDHEVAQVLAAVVADDPRRWLQAKLELFLDAAATRRPAL
ncbi:putative transcriptional regulator, TetR family [Nocardia nova SH22a]|uniref:Putative transcriptional regulator, TetR family n=1 Tax=Nocardia nova SH22a TaxID=1415166 RepID=W5TQG8_9NOCA|nr:putative transcriptional regulator, TetR family [Nocardia nova SH22a]